MTVKKFAVGCCTMLATASLALFGWVAPAEAVGTSGYYTYISATNCGTFKANRSLTTSAWGTYSATLGFSGYTMKWTGHTSETVYSACGSAAPYGPYSVAAPTMKQTTKFTVSGSGITSCTAGSSGWSCSGGVTSRTAKHTRTRYNSSQITDYATSVTMKGSYCNAATLTVSGYIEEGSTSASTQILKRTWAC